MEQCMKSPAIRRITGIFLLVAGAVVVAFAGEPPQELSTAAQVRGLSRADKFVEHPVHLRGCVLYFETSEEQGPSVILADATASVYVRLVDRRFVAGVARGTVLDVRGNVNPGEFAPIVIATAVSVEGTAPIPPPTPVTFDALETGYFDSQWVEVTGIVRRVSHIDVAPDFVRMHLATGGGRLPVILYAPPGNQRQGLPPVNAKVRIAGIAYYQFNRRGRALGPILTAPGGVVPAILKAPPEVDPLCKIDRLRTFSDNPDFGHRIRIHGTVTHREPGLAIWLQEDGQGVRVKAADSVSYAPGEVVEVAGFLAKSEDYSPVMEDVTVTRVAFGEPPAPAVLESARQALDHDAGLVSIKAELREVMRVPAGLRLVLRHDGLDFAASLRLEASVPPPDWEAGSIVLATGICSVLQMSSGDLPGIMDPREFQVLLRSPADLKILRAPPWWNAARLSWALGGAVLLLCLAVGGTVWTSRRRLRRAAEAHRQSEQQFSAVLSERNRIAREIHDTLAQGLGAISLRLGMIMPYLSEGSKAVEHLEEASGIARECMGEARQSIWNMRSQSLENHDLAEALAGLFDEITDVDEIDASFEIAGTPVRFSPVVENNLLRIGQEAVANAVKHSGASRIRMDFTYRPHGVLVRIVDNGSGFDPKAVPPGNSHFGVLGMRERAREIGAKIRINSQPGKGTEVRFEFTAARDSS